MKSVQAKRKTGILLTSFAFLIASLFFSFPLTHAADSSCVQCHTSEKQLKALHKPVKIPVEAGEG